MVVCVHACVCTCVYVSCEIETSLIMALLGVRTVWETRHIEVHFRLYRLTRKIMRYRADSRVYKLSVRVCTCAASQGTGIALVRAV